MVSELRSGRARGVPGRVLGAAVVLAIVALVLVSSDDRRVRRDDRPPDDAGVHPPIPIGGGTLVDPAGPTAPTTEAPKAGDDRGRTHVAPRREPPVPPGPAPTSGGPDSGLVSDFEGETVASAFGSGWSFSTDTIVGGRSTATFGLVPGGADGSRGALRIAGVIEDRRPPRWAGAQFSPGPRMMAPADLSSRKAISFRARGDGRTYVIMIFWISGGFLRAEKSFVAGKDWETHRFAIGDFGGCDGRAVVGIFLGGGPDAGAFELLVDDVRIE